MSGLSESDVSEYLKALRASALRYPNCLIANCDCNSKNGEWHKGCHCMCHFDAMNATYGNNNWTLADFGREVEKDREGGQDAETDSE